MKIVVHTGMVWVYRISGGWYTHLKAFPDAMKKVKVGKEVEYVPDPEHPSVLAFAKK